MKTVIIPWYFLLCLLMSGCSLPILNLPATQETELFAQGLDRYLATGDQRTLKRLPQEYPHGKWRSKAEGVLRMIAQQRQQQAEQQQQQEQREQAEQLQEQREQVEQQLALCQREKNALVQDNQLLEETLKQLKEALIDSEKRTE